MDAFLFPVYECTQQTKAPKPREVKLKTGELDLMAQKAPHSPIFPISQFELYPCTLV